MSRFTGDVDVRFSGDGTMKARLVEPLTWEEDFLGSGRVVVVPAGFVSDGATVPRVFWWIMPPWGSRYTKAAILHDYILKVDRPRRKRADDQFRLALEALGASPSYAALLWLSVRVFSVLWRRAPD